MNEPSEEKVHSDIISKIKSGEVTMHSRTFLLWRTTFWALAVLLLVAAAAFLVSFVVFILQASGVWDLPGFGLHGTGEFLMYFPWLFIPAVLLFAWLTEVFVRKYSLAYRLPVLYVALGSLVLIGAVSLAVLATPLHQKLFESAENEGLPVVGAMYRFFGQSHPDDFYVGKVASTSPDGCILVMRDGQSVNVAVASSTQMYGGSLRLGDLVEIVGEESSGSVEAVDIKKLPDNRPAFFRPPPR